MSRDSYRQSTTTPEEAAEHDRVYGALAASTRRLMEAQLMTEVDQGEALAVAAEVDRLAERLAAARRSDPHGVEIGPGARVRNHGNSVVGLRNPIAPPLDVHRSPSGSARAAFHLGPLWEGPPGLVHGGVTAMLLDQLCGEAAGANGTPGMTARLTLDYRRPTPLGELSAEAEVVRTDGVKTTVHGRIVDAEGRPTVEAEALMVLPRWARELFGEPGRGPDRFE